MVRGSSIRFTQDSHLTTNGFFDQLFPARIMSAIFTFSSYVIRETLHNKLIHFALIVLVATLGIGNLFAQLMLGSPLKVILDFNLLAYQLFCLGFITIFVVPYFNTPERLAQFVPLLVPLVHGRTQLLLGVLLAFTAILGGAGTMYFAATTLLTYLQTGFVALHLWLAMLTTFVEALYLVCLSLFLSLLLPQALTYFALFALYVGGYAQPTIVNFLTKNGLVWLGFAANYCLPDLSFLDIKSLVIYQIPFDVMPLFIALLYSIAIAAIFFLLATTVFQSKQL